MFISVGLTESICEHHLTVLTLPSFFFGSKLNRQEKMMPKELPKTTYEGAQGWITRSSRKSYKEYVHKIF